ncbi:poly-gamma-glutamate hydrolase family protein [Halalkalicoccus ordinarius]|uniref:poly-gamma-glutamate hydrolase family protein n=1 Tax=Halalkalicoccus ordinarius TaxID=3116651 RepID=UPI00300EAB36
MKAVGSSLGLSVGAKTLVRNGKATDSITIRRYNGDATLRREHCTVGEDRLEEGGIEIGEQIRVGSDDFHSTYDSGLYTVVGTASSPGTVEMNKEGLARLGLKNNTSGFVRANAPHPEYETRGEADEHDEYGEILVDDGEQSDLVACAVHGGWIEYRTDEQAAYVAEALDVTEWSCVGYNDGGGAYDRWHITSTDIDRRAFPKLDRIGDRGFTHAVSFHGFSEPGIAIGGTASRSLRMKFRDEIDGMAEGKYDVYLADDGPYAGDSPENFANWIAGGDGGVQIEQSWDARTDDWEAIAAAVVEVYSDTL